MKYTATQVFIHLIEAARFLHENAVDRDSNPFGFNQNLGMVVALRIIKENATERDIWLFAGALWRYCDKSALARFCFEVEGEGFETQFDFESDEFLRSNHPGHDVIAMIEVADFAERLRHQGWNQQWSPFSGPAQDAWRRVFSTS